jgi:AraC family transcriptional activator of pobA
MGPTRMRARRGTGPPVYTYEVVPGVPPVSAMRLGKDAQYWPPGTIPAHAHDFLVLAYCERGGGSMRLGGREWRLERGGLYVIAPG